MELGAVFIMVFFLAGLCWVSPFVWAWMVIHLGLLAFILLMGILLILVDRWEA